jgi:hypothetical protein
MEKLVSNSRGALGFGIFVSGLAGNPKEVLSTNHAEITLEEPSGK